MGFKSVIRESLCNAAYATGVVASRRNAQRGKACVLMYHRVFPDDSDWIPITQPGMFVTESTFRRHMQYVAEFYRPLTVDEFADGLEAKRFPDDKPCALITMDDGYRDNLTCALPVMREFGVPGVIFLATDFVGGRELFWTERAARAFSRIHMVISDPSAPDPDLSGIAPVAGELSRNGDSFSNRGVVVDRIVERMKGMDEADRGPLLAAAESLVPDAASEREVVDWDEALELAGGGIALGSHTRSHRILTQADAEGRRSEIFESGRTIEEKTGTFPRAFSFPNGDHDDGAVEMVREAGYGVAFTVTRGFVTADDDPYRLGRISIHDGPTRTTPLFAAKIAGVLP